MDFLDELHKLLESKEFDINTDLNLVRKKKNGDDQMFSTKSTNIVCVWKGNKWQTDICEVKN